MIVPRPLKTEPIPETLLVAEEPRLEVILLISSVLSLKIDSDNADSADSLDILAKFKAFETLPILSKLLIALVSDSIEEALPLKLENSLIKSL